MRDHFGPEPPQGLLRHEGTLRFRRRMPGSSSSGPVEVWKDRMKPAIRSYMHVWEITISRTRFSQTTTIMATKQEHHSTVWKLSLASFAFVISLASLTGCADNNVPGTNVGNNGKCTALPCDCNGTVAGPDQVGCTCSAHDTAPGTWVCDNRPTIPLDHQPAPVASDSVRMMQ